MPGHDDKQKLESIPVGSLRMIPLQGCMEMGEKIDKYLIKWRAARESEH